MTNYSYKKEDLDKTNNDENKSDKYKGITQEDIDREMQLRLEGGGETKPQSSKKKFTEDLMLNHYEEEKRKFPTHEEIQAEYDRTHWKEHLKNLGSEAGNYGERYGKRGGRYNERRSKNGNIYRQYF